MTKSPFIVSLFLCASISLGTLPTLASEEIKNENFSLKNEIEESNKSLTEKDIQILEKEANEGEVEAQFELGTYYLGEFNKLTKFYNDYYCFDIYQTDGHRAVRKEIGIAGKNTFIYFKMAADNKYKKAYSKVADCFSNRIGVAENKDEAIKYYQLAVN